MCIVKYQLFSTMTTDRRWELLAVLLMTLQWAMGDPHIPSSSGAKKVGQYLRSTPPPEIQPIGRPVYTSTSEPTLTVVEPEKCQDISDVVLRLSRIGILVVGDDVVASFRVTELHLDNNGITQVSVGAFAMVPRLVTLNLSSNNISTDRLLYFEEHKGLRRLIVDNNTPLNPKELELKTTHQPLPNLWELTLTRSSVAVFAVSLNKFAPNLARLSLSGNKIESSEFLKDVPKSLTHLDLSENSISEIGSWLPNGLLELTVAGNQIKELCAESCGDSSLSLHKLTSLMTLNASGNAIATVQADAFQSLSNLTVLDLSRNEILQLLGTHWDRTWRIQELYLAMNKLTSVPKLCQLYSLQRLDLSGNTIASLTNENFCDNLNKLQFLFLNDNVIIEAEGDAFGKFKALRTLDLSGNMLTTLPSNLISTTALEVLLMRNNRITTLENLVKERGNLRELHMQDNPLLVISTSWINSKYLPYLQIMLKDRLEDPLAKAIACVQENTAEQTDNNYRGLFA